MPSNLWNGVARKERVWGEKVLTEGEGEGRKERGKNPPLAPRFASALSPDSLFHRRRRSPVISLRKCHMEMTAEEAGAQLRNGTGKENAFLRPIKSQYISCAERLFCLLVHVTKRRAVQWCDWGVSVTRGRASLHL